MHCPHLLPHAQFFQILQIINLITELSFITQKACAVTPGAHMLLGLPVKVFFSGPLNRFVFNHVALQLPVSAIGKLTHWKKAEEETWCACKVVHAVKAPWGPTPSKTCLGLSAEDGDTNSSVVTGLLFFCHQLCSGEHHLLGPLHCVCVMLWWQWWSLVWSPNHVPPVWLCY